jgi:hypothetical protein
MGTCGWWPTADGRRVSHEGSRPGGELPQPAHPSQPTSRRGAQAPRLPTRPVRRVAAHERHPPSDAKTRRLGRVHRLPLDSMAPKHMAPKAVRPLCEGHLPADAAHNPTDHSDHPSASCPFNVFRSRSVEIAPESAPRMASDQEICTSQAGALALDRPTSTRRTQRMT